MVKLLLNKGANLSAIDKRERQPIHCAAYLGKPISALWHRVLIEMAFIEACRRASGCIPSRPDSYSYLNYNPYVCNHR